MNGQCREGIQELQNGTRLFALLQILSVSVGKTFKRTYQYSAWRRLVGWGGIALR
jgi:hypothetical protein